MLHWPDSLDPEAAVTSVGLRVAKKARKSKAPIPNIKRLRICFILALLCIFQFAPRGRIS